MPALNLILFGKNPKRDSHRKEYYVESRGDSGVMNMGRRNLCSGLCENIRNKEQENRESMDKFIFLLQ